MPEGGDHVNGVIVYLRRQRGRWGKVPEEGEHSISEMSKKNCQTLSIECPNVKLGNDKPQDSYHNFNFYCI